MICETHQTVQRVQLAACTCPKCIGKKKIITETAEEKPEFLNTECESVSRSKLLYVIIAGLTYSYE